MQMKTSNDNNEEKEGENGGTDCGRKCRAETSISASAEAKQFHGKNSSPEKTRKRYHLFI